MSTYADYFNEQYRGHVPSGPVRMTISRSDKPTEGQWEASESCTVEELMDQEDPVGPAINAPTEGPASTGFLSWLHPSSFAWVLDTYVIFLTSRNILLSSLEHVEAFTHELLCAQLRPQSSMPCVYLIVPHVVLEEIDLLKQSTRPHGTTTIGALARRASHWILDTVQQQKYSRNYEQRPLDPKLWILHVQALSTRSTEQHHLVGTRVSPRPTTKRLWPFVRSYTRDTGPI